MSVVRVTIEDGQQLTAESKFPAYKGFAFVVRPLPVDAVVRHVQDGRPFHVKVPEMLAKQLVSWNAAAGDGEGTLPITVETLKKLPYPLLDEMNDAVCGYAGTGEAAARAKN